MVYFPLLTPSKTSKSSSEIHRLGKYISIALIPTLTGLAGISNSDETLVRGVVDAILDMFFLDVRSGVDE
jgi:hypothetical protein